MRASVGVVKNSKAAQAVGPGAGIKMNTAKQTGLFDAEFPRSVECSGGELLPLVASLKASGCCVLATTVTGTSGWNLAVDWPNQPEPHFVLRAFKPADFSRHVARWRFFPLPALS